MSYQDQYNTYFNKKSPKYYNKKVVDKPKSNGKYIKSPSSPMDSFDWDLWLRDNDQFYQTLEEEMKKTEIDKGLYEKYLELLKAGELLPNTTFEMFEKSHADFDTDIISKINKRVRDNKEASEGIASILALSPGKRI